MKNILMILSIGCIHSIITANPSHSQTGACCVNERCVGTMEEMACWDMDGFWFQGEDCDQGFECPTEYPCGPYVVGDYNGNGVFNIADVFDAYSMLKTGAPVYPNLLCECPEGSGNEWPVRMDVNSSCSVNIADIVKAYYAVHPKPLWPCVFCPPAPGRREVLK